MKRRNFLKRAGVGISALGGLSGCLTSPGRNNELPFTVATYSAFVDAPSTSPGAYVKKEFEKRYDVNMKWFVPNNELNYFIQRRKQGMTIDTDMYYGLTPTDFARADSHLGEKGLFRQLDTSKIKNYSAIKDHLTIDPKGRVVPTYTSYISLVYNENKIDAPETFQQLTSPKYKGKLLVPNPQNSQTGLDFLYWTIKNFGTSGYLDYWKQLQQNNVHILKDWGAAYSAYSNGEAPMVVSFSTDQVYAARYNQKMSRHQIGFLNNQGYSYIEGAGQFVNTNKIDIANKFLDFILDPEVQAKIAVKNVGLPAVTNATLPDNFSKLVHTPQNPVSFGYDKLVGNVDKWLSDWSKQIASK
ncbi:MAG: thiamine ABC transporter substrate binding subunit [Halobacteriaceae archaeon]